MNGGLSFMSNPRRDSELDRLNLALSSAEMGTWDWDLPTGVIWLDERMHVLLGLALRSGSARWDSPWLARAEKIPQEERTVSLTNPIVERSWRMSRYSLLVRRKI